MLSEAAASRRDSVKRKNPVLLYFVSVWTMIELEARKLSKDPTEMIIRGVQPALWLLIFGQAFSNIRGIPTGGVNYMEFLTPGILSQSITFVSIFYGIMIIWEKDMGLLQKLMSTPMRHSAFILGKMLSASLRALSQSVVILLISLLLGVRLDWGVGQIFGLLVSVILGACFFSGLSIVIASLVRTRERMMGFGQLITMPLFFASSALYPISIMPAWLKALAVVNPMTYLVDSLRGLLLVSHTANLFRDWGILLFASALMLLFSVRLLPRIMNG